MTEILSMLAGIGFYLALGLLLYWISCKVHGGRY